MGQSFPLDLIFQIFTTLPFKCHLMLGIVDWSLTDLHSCRLYHGIKHTHVLELRVGVGLFSCPALSPVHGTDTTVRDITVREPATLVRFTSE